MGTTEALPSVYLIDLSFVSLFGFADYRIKIFFSIYNRLSFVQSSFLSNILQNHSLLIQERGKEKMHRNYQGFDFIDYSI